MTSPAVLDAPIKEQVGTLDMFDFEELLLHDVKCESLHKVPGNTVCSGTVVARKITSCGFSFLICENARVWNEMVITTESGTLCHPMCGNSVGVCWRIHAV